MYCFNFQVSGNWHIYTNNLVISPDTHLTWDAVHILKHLSTGMPIECRYEGWVHFMHFSALGGSLLCIPLPSFY